MRGRHSLSVIAPPTRGRWWRYIREEPMATSTRHILALSGGKDSTALTLPPRPRAGNGVRVLRHPQGTAGDLRLFAEMTQ